MEKTFTTAEAAIIISERTNKPMSPRRVQDECKIGNIKAKKFGTDKKYVYIIGEKALSHYVRRHPGKQSSK